jgi:hydrogenase maturation protease
MTRALVLGVGNLGRGDDGAGIVAARRLSRKPPGDATVMECWGDAGRILEALSGRDRVIVVDAASGGGPPGTIHRFEAHRAPLPASVLCTSSHSWGLVEAIEVARVLGRLPASLVVYAIEGQMFELGRGLSTPAKRALRVVEGRIRRDLGTPPRRRRASRARVPQLH